MNKNELLHAIAKEANVSLIDAKKCLNAFLKTTTEILKKNESIILIGFGTFTTKKRAARNGRNLKTGKTVKISATTVPNFKAGKTLKEIVNG